MYKREPDEYHKLIWLNKPMFKGIELIAKFEKISKKQAAHLFLEKGSFPPGYLYRKPLLTWFWKAGRNW